MLTKKQMLVSSIVFLGIVIGQVKVKAESSHGSDESKAKATLVSTATDDAAWDNQPPKQPNPTGPAPDPTKFQFHDDIQSVEELNDFDEDIGVGESQDKVLADHVVPSSCQDWSVYLETKRKSLLRLEREINRKKSMLDQLNASLKDSMQQYSVTEKRVKKLLKVDTSELADSMEMKKMVSLYESLSPEEAADRMKNLDLDITLSMLKSMKPKNLMKIMSAMDAKLSAALSSKLIRGF